MRARLGAAKKIKGTLQAHSLNSPLPLFYLSLTPLHPFLPPFIFWPVEITCPLARAHHQSHDSLRVASVMAAALIESRGRVRLCLCLDTVVCAWEMTSEWKVYFFFNLLKAPCLSGLHLCLLLPLFPPPLSVSLRLSGHSAQALRGWSSVCLAVPLLFSPFFCAVYQSI